MVVLHYYFFVGLTPNVKVTTDRFDDTIIINQEPVSAASNLDEGWHKLGFTWYKRSPEVVFLTAGINGIKTITDLNLKIDGEFLGAKKVGAKTIYNKLSYRKFGMSHENFIKMANADVMKMKLVQESDYTVSSFGRTNASAVVDKKFIPFIKQIIEYMEESEEE